MAASAAQAADMEVRVMSFNVWSGEDTAAGRAKLVQIIQAADADIVGLQEVSASALSSIASSLGWYSFQESGGDEQIVSRYPILQAAPGSWGAQFELTPGHTAWLFNAHLSPYPYQPYDLRDGVLPMNEANVIAAAASARGGQVTSMLNDMAASGALTSGEPVFLTGDFNEPSHLDWTEAAAIATPRPYDLKVAWPASTRVTAQGFVDTFRAVRPDEVNDHGYTWTPGAPPPNIDPNDVHDRIDFVYHRGANVTPLSAQTLGFNANDGDTDIAVAGYNADHRSVVGAHRISGLEGTTLTFSKLGANGAAIPQSYGDRLLTSPGTLVAYSAAGGGAWKFWEENNWNKGGVTYLDSGDGQQANGSAIYNLLLSPDAGRGLSLQTFDLIDFADGDGLGQSVLWELLNPAGGLMTSGTATVADGATLHIATGLVGILNGDLTLRLRHLSGVNNELALDNVAFEETAAAAATPDVNSDGLVNIFDVNFVSSHWAASGGPATPGDANHDGVVNVFDVNAISAGWTNPSGSASVSTENSAVPEPATLCLACLAVLVTVIFRRA